MVTLPTRSGCTYLGTSGDINVVTVDEREIERRGRIGYKNLPIR